MSKVSEALSSIQTKITEGEKEFFSRMKNFHSVNESLDFPTHNEFQVQPNCLQSESELEFLTVIRGSYSPMSSSGTISLFSKNIEINCLLICQEFHKLADRKLSNTECNEIREFVWSMVYYHEYFHYMSDYIRIAFPLSPTSTWDVIIEEALAVAWSFIKVSDEAFQHSFSNNFLLESFFKRKLERNIIYDLLFSYTSPGYKDFDLYVDKNSKTNRTKFYEAVEKFFLSSGLSAIQSVDPLGIINVIGMSESSDNWELNIK